jgi:hypothetical protein
MPSNKKSGSGKSKSKRQLKYKDITAYAAGSQVRGGNWPSQKQKDEAASQGQGAQNLLLANTVSLGRNQGNLPSGDAFRLDGTPTNPVLYRTGRQKKDGSVDNRGRIVDGKTKTPTAGTAKARTARNQKSFGTTQKMTSKKVTSMRNPTKPKATLQGRGSANATISAKAAATPRSTKSKLKRGR